MVSTKGWAGLYRSTKKMLRIRVCVCVCVCVCVFGRSRNGHRFEMCTRSPGPTASCLGRLRL